MYHYVIVGLGKTGVSCAEYLSSRGETFFIVDSREQPPGLETVHQKFPHIRVYTGVDDASVLVEAETMIVSPGVPLDTEMVVKALQSGMALLSDIDLFCQAIEAPVIGITGSNGKSTVTEMLGIMADYAGVNAGVGGNIGVPVLDLLKESPRDLYVLELSSFQLERVASLQPTVALMLNLSPDHLDVHHTMEAYKQAKHCIFDRCEVAVFNQDDRQTWPEVSENIKTCSFTSNAPSADQFGIVRQDGAFWLAKGGHPLLCENDLKIVGFHNLVNAVAALAAGEQLGFPLSSMLNALQHFSGLPHRCQWVANRCGADWFNDSKGTNEVASIAAIEGLAFVDGKKLVLIAGGDGKGADFYALAHSIEAHVREVILFGRDAYKIEAAINYMTPVTNVGTLEEAVTHAGNMVRPGERVLLSPACTSWDMFANYQERGELFMQQVNGLLDT